jgi:ABC-type dipeptide/oligopeptide/nickel transport system ATPase subunit/GNAT superfamily N-acetyltransferase
MHLTRHILRSTPVQSSNRLSQVLGMFDVEPPAVSTVEWHVDLDLPDDWNIGVIVGASGSGKTTVARELFGNYFAGDFGWSTTHSIIDAFPLTLPVKRVTDLLSSVGFSSPPAWMRPFQCLSNGQQFRVNLARILAEALVDGQIKVVDEYSSVVDRTAAKIGSAAVARTIRKHKLQFIAVTCHYDVLDWLQPDWVYDVAAEIMLENRESQIEKNGGAHIDPASSILNAQSSVPSREGLQRYHRPKIELEIIRSDRSAWPRFKPHHYLSAQLHPAAACFVGLVQDQPAAFTAVLPFPHPTHSGYREHRTVCLPDYQGVGIGNAMSEFVAAVYKATGKPYTSTTSRPAMIYHRAKSPLWRMTRKPGLTGGGRRFSLMRKTAAVDRITAGFEYVGPARFEEARGLQVLSEAKPSRRM